jgi:hypothetical protein
MVPHRRAAGYATVGVTATRLAFFRDDAALVTTDDRTSLDADFVRDSSGRIGWCRWGARIQPRLS